MTHVRFHATPIKIKDRIIIQIPKEVSIDFPSRGMVMVEAKINKAVIKIPLEPDGLGSHWFEVTPDLMVKADLQIDKPITLFIRPIDEWIEPPIPEDILLALQNKQVENHWNAITTKARWEWIRWIRSTKNADTRKKRIETACSMLSDGKKRPCCFNHSICTVADISKNGMLILSNLPPE